MFILGKLLISAIVLLVVIVLFGYILLQTKQESESNTKLSSNEEDKFEIKQITDSNSNDVINLADRRL